jgi:hypothetical protein
MYKCHKKQNCHIYIILIFKMEIQKKLTKSLLNILFFADHHYYYYYFENNHY